MSCTSAPRFFFSLVNFVIDVSCVLSVKLRFSNHKEKHPKSALRQIVSFEDFESRQVEDPPAEACFAWLASTGGVEKREAPKPFIQKARQLDLDAPWHCCAPIGSLSLLLLLFGCN